MSWLQKMIRLAGPEDYLASLGAPPETIQWIMSQPNPQFFVNEFRKNPGVDVTTLQAPQTKETYTQRELQRVSLYGRHTGDNSLQKWALIQLKKLRVRPNPLSNGAMDYDYAMGMTEFDNRLQQINDWYHMGNWDGRPVDINSFTWEQAWVASVRWHQESAKLGAKLQYEPTNPELVVFQKPEWKGWTIQKIVSENDLQREGYLMNHCVGNEEYFRNTQSGNSEIYSLRDGENNPHITIDMAPGYNEINQIMGHSNSDPKEEYKVYIRDWLEQFQKERPGIKLKGDDFEFDFSNTENDDIDKEIERIVYTGNDYGLKNPLDELDAEDIYDAVIGELKSGGYRTHDDTRNVHHIGPTIAKVAWDADKHRAEMYGIIGNRSLPEVKDISLNILFPEIKQMTPEARSDAFKHKSKTLGVGWLWSKIEESNESFMDNYDYFEPYTKREEFETEEEYDKARDEEFYEYEREVRSSNLPYALDDAIATALVELSKTNPFLPEHSGFKTPEVAVAERVNWLRKIS